MNIRQPTDGDESAAIHDLTRRQLQIVQLLTTGSSNKEIARTLGLTEGTVKLHLHAIYEKLGVSNRGKLVALFLRYRGSEGNLQA